MAFLLFFFFGGGVLICGKTLFLSFTGIVNIAYPQQQCARLGMSSQSNKMRNKQTKKECVFEPVMSFLLRINYSEFLVLSEDHFLLEHFDDSCSHLTPPPQLYCFFSVSDSPSFYLKSVVICNVAPDPLLL